MAMPESQTRVSSDRAGLEAIPIPIPFPTRHFGIVIGIVVGNEPFLKAIDYREGR